MNYDNLKKAVDGFQTSYAVLPNGQRLFTDGHILCIVPQEFDYPDAMLSTDKERRADSMIKLWEKTVREIADAPLALLTLVKDESEPYYRRSFSSGKKWVVHINEKYYRVFDQAAEFRGSGDEKKVTVHGDHKLVGIVMPLRHWGKQYPDVESPTDEQLYYKEPPSEDDDEEDDCPRCGGTGKINR